MNERAAIAVTFSLLLEERAEADQEIWNMVCERNGVKPCLSTNAQMMRDYSRRVRVLEPIPKNRMAWDMFCKVCQSYRLLASDYVEVFFE